MGKKSAKLPFTKLSSLLCIIPANAKCAPKLAYLKLNLVLAVELVVKKQLRLSSLHILIT
jgi:hypothetical protein